MSCIALSIVTEESAGVLLAGGGPHFAFARFHRGASAPTHASSFLYSSLLGHREGNIRPRPAAQRACAFPDSFPKASVGPLPTKQPLGAWERPSLASVPAECPE